MSKDIMTAQQLKEMFLKEAEPLVKEYVNAALGESSFKSTNSDARAEVWSVLKELILGASDKLDINIESAEDVLKAVTDGKCTFDEGQKLLGLYKQMKEINTVGILPGAQGGGGLTINILGSKSPTTVNPEPIEHDNG